MKLGEGGEMAVVENAWTCEWNHLDFAIWRRLQQKAKHWQGWGVYLIKLVI